MFVTPIIVAQNKVKALILLFVLDTDLLSLSDLCLNAKFKPCLCRSYTESDSLPKDLYYEWLYLKPMNLTEEFMFSAPVTQLVT